jgi:hypothetical protein
MDDKPIAVFNAYDNETMELYSHALGYSLALTEIKEILRGYLKYGHTFTSIDQAIETMRNELGDLENDYHLPQS